MLKYFLKFSSTTNKTGATIFTYKIHKVNMVNSISIFCVINRLPKYWSLISIAGKRNVGVVVYVVFC